MHNKVQIYFYVLSQNQINNHCNDSILSSLTDKELITNLGIDYSVAIKFFSGIYTGKSMQLQPQWLHKTK